MKNSFGARDVLSVSGREYEIYRLSSLEPEYRIQTLPYCIKILLENQLRNEDGINITRSAIQALANWKPRNGTQEIAFVPARVLLQDFTGVPAAADLAAMREAIAESGGDPQRINPLSPVDLVIDHSVQVDYFAQADASELNSILEFQRNGERYAFLRWAQSAFRGFRVVPPDTGIVHQVNLEYLAQVVASKTANGHTLAFPDTVVGTDSHTTMINGLGVLGWGVGGIEAEAGMLGQPVSMLIPEVVGFELTGRLPEGATATDLVLTITEKLRREGVVGKFVEFFGDGLEHLPIADRATIANMAPEYGATCGIFPIDHKTLKFLELSGRTEKHLALIEAYAQHQGLFFDRTAPCPTYSERIKLNLDSVEPSLAGPRRPQDRVTLTSLKSEFEQQVHRLQEERGGISDTDSGISRFLNEGGTTAIAAEEASHVGAVTIQENGGEFVLSDGAVVIAALTSCTNTSNPSVMIAAGLLARAAVARGLQAKPWVKTSLAPGSPAVTAYLQEAGLIEPLSRLGFDLVGYGCTTCIGNSGPLPPAISEAIHKGELITAAVLSGNRNFEGRIHADVHLNYLASPPLVVAFAIAGTMALDPLHDPLDYDAQGNPVYLRDIWPSSHSIAETSQRFVQERIYKETYRDVFAGDSRWNGLPVGHTPLYPWDAGSTYIRRPPFFSHHQPPQTGENLINARCLVLLGDSVTTDHISPAGAIPVGTPAGQWLMDHGVVPSDFNSYGSRRGNHEVMVRGTFANIRLRNRLVSPREGGWTVHHPTGDVMSIFEAAELYRTETVPLIVIAGTEYGTGSSRDWASKGTRLLGVRVVIARSFERIHRSNLVGMGVLPLQFQDGDSAESLGIDGSEIFSVRGISEKAQRAEVIAVPATGDPIRFYPLIRIDTPNEWQYFRQGGILHYVLHQIQKQTM